MTTITTNKDAFYFPHDSNAKDDPKCVLLVEQLGLEGYGIYWVLIELLREQPDFCYPLNLVSAIARRYNTTAEKMMAVIRSYELFQSNDEKFFFSPSLLNRMTAINERRHKLQQAGRKGGKSRAQASLKPALSTDKATLKQVKESKVKESKVKEINKELVSEISVYFNFNELNHFDKIREIHQFIQLLTHHQQIDHFKTQFAAYCQYKQSSGQIVHGFKTFLGDVQDQYQNGAWNAENWPAKLNGSGIVPVDHANFLSELTQNK